MKKYLYLLTFLTLPFTLIAQTQITKAYINQYKDIAMKEMKRTGVPASITLAQAIVESSSGESNLAKKFNNHFGIKCKIEWKGETTYQDDDAKQECFRVYPNAESSFRDHSDFLKNRPNYANLFELDPVDDTAWANGLKKAGYATASDYPKKLLKVIDDYELAQYNFPELANETEEPADTNAIVNSSPLVKANTNNASPSTNASTSTITNTSTASNTANDLATKELLALNKVQGVGQTNSSKASLPAMQGVGPLPNSSTTASTAISATPLLKKEKEIVQAIDTVVKKKKNGSYPLIGKFKINHVAAIWAEEGRSFLEIANTYQVALYKLYQYNDLPETDLVLEDQLIFIGEKKKESDKKVHIIKEGETLYGISQSEGIQLKFLKAYNVDATDANLVPGKVLYLFNMPKEPALKPTANKVESAKEPVKSNSLFKLPFLKKKK
jgi:LysM repeat protein